MNSNVNELRPVICKKCGRVIVSVITAAKALCPKCKVWSTNKKEKEVC
ncbi:hypothetical protein SPSIL_017050 [Sporomusa silvacetica DSM 10669]|uniref:Mu-like prophage protein Com n=1 Tax=Sporomusa silvacetica DSM 10669 TaxID=1123289 RepID=A0ABZ3IIY5_9FIRM|nr:hypothetical protein [Sporomusa silvacetica]OZC18358.1 hypothetical protein SPSIL_25580 [Sporomusa silvacetica DSM 10669]